MPHHIIIVPAEPHHISNIYKRIRNSDREEIWYTSGHSPLKALKFAVKVSFESYALYRNNCLTALFGMVLNNQGNIGIPWLLGSIDLEYISPYQWRRLGKTYIEKWLTHVPILRNYIYAKNHKSCRWLRHMGFTLSPPQKFGIFNQYFQCFEITNTRSTTSSDLYLSI